MKNVLLSDCYTWRGFTPDEIIPKGAITKLQMNNAWSDTEWIHDGYGQCRILGDADHGWTKASTELNVFSRAATKEEMHKCFPEDYAAAPSKPETKDNKLEVCFHPYTITQFEGTQFIHNGIGELAPLGDSTIAINWGRCMYPDRHKFVRTATAEEKKKYFPGVSIGSNHIYSRAAVTVCAGVGMWIHDGYGHCATMDKTEGKVLWFRMTPGNHSYLRSATFEERVKYRLDFTTPTKETKKETPKVKIPERGAVTYHDGHPYVSYIHDGKGNYSLLLENAKEPFWVPSNNFEWDMPHRYATPEEMDRYFSKTATTDVAVNKPVPKEETPKKEVIAFPPFAITKILYDEYIHNGFGELQVVSEPHGKWTPCRFDASHDLVRMATGEEKAKFFPNQFPPAKIHFKRGTVTRCNDFSWIHDGYNNTVCMDNDFRNIQDGMRKWVGVIPFSHTFFRIATDEELAKYHLKLPENTKSVQITRAYGLADILSKGDISHSRFNTGTEFIHDGLGNYSTISKDLECFWVTGEGVPWLVPHRKATPEEMAKYFPLSEAAPSGSSMKFPATTQVWTRKDDEIKIDDYAIDYGNVVGHKAMANYFEDKTRASNEPVLDSILVKANGNAIRISPHLDGYKVVNDKDYTVYAQVPDLACATKIGCALCGVESFVDASIRHIYKTT